MGNSVEFGFSCNNSFSGFPEISMRSSSTKTTQETDYALDYRLISSWDDAFNGEVSIDNLSSKILEEWQLSFDFDGNISSIWNAEIISHVGNHYVIKGRDYNQNINIDEKVTFGFLADGVGNKSQIKNSILSCNISGNTDDTLPDNPTDPGTDEPIPQDELIILYANEIEFLADNTYKTVYFYAFPQVPVSSITLIDSNTNTIITNMYDDGKYSISGDDMVGDGVYSAKYTIYADDSKDLCHSFKAMLNEKNFSNIVEINSYAPFTEQELADMQYVIEAIKATLGNTPIPIEMITVPVSDLQNGSDYAGLFEKRYAETYEKLASLKEEGKIYHFSYDSNEKQFICQFPNGVTFKISLIDNPKPVDTDDFSFPELSGKYTGYSAVILNAFEDTAFRTNFYESLNEEWVELGLSVEYDDHVTVFDLKNKLSDKDIVCLSGHGSTSGLRPVFCLTDDEWTTASSYYYSTDIKSKRIEPWITSSGSYYVVFSDFIDFYYGGSTLAGSFVFSESCHFFGNSQVGFKDEFAKSFTNSSAEAVVGFSESVMAVYSRDLMVYYIYELLEGKDAGTAFANARNVYGKNDYEYRKPSFFEYLFDKDCFDKMGNTAVSLLYGDNSATLVKPLQNGDFEKVFSYVDSTPLGWECNGDVRLLATLGEIEPYDSRMAFISTGIGSLTGSYLGGTQGSSMKQTFQNTDYTNLEFYYNFISEEPMEYVGSSFDDKFVVRINDSKGNILVSETLETVNTSSWYPVKNIDFEGGDSTVFHTLWKVAKIDVSKYQNQDIQIEFLVYDVGDSAYDSAVVIDNVSCSK